jgi:tetratricopeptide (TPR) repeat protein
VLCIWFEEWARILEIQHLFAEIWPYQVIDYFRIGFSHFKLGSYSDAIDAFEAVITFSPRDS